MYIMADDLDISRVIGPVKQSKRSLYLNWVGSDERGGR